MRRLGSARCWLWQNSVGFALVRTSGKRAARSGARDRADLRLLEVGQRRVAVIEEGFRIELDLARRRGETARIAVRIGLGVFGVARPQRHAQAAGGGTQLLKRNAGGAELMAIGGLDVAVPELRAEAEAAGEIEDDIGIGARLAGRRHDRLAELDERLRVRADLEADLQRLALEAEATGSTTSASSAVGVMNRSAWA